MTSAEASRSVGVFHPASQTQALPSRIWFSRHGQSINNKQDRIGGNTCLTREGQAYAYGLQDKLNTRLPQGQSARVLLSTLIRTAQTAQHVPSPHEAWPELDEINAGICNNMTYGEIAQRYPDEFKARAADKLRYRYPGGESYEDLIARVSPVLQALRGETRPVLVVAHQAVLRVLYGLLRGYPTEDIPRIKFPQHVLVEFRVAPDGTLEEERFEVDVAAYMDRVAPPAAAATAAVPAAAVPTAAAVRAEVKVEAAVVPTVAAVPPVGKDVAAVVPTAVAAMAVAGLSCAASTPQGRLSACSSEARVPVRADAEAGPEARGQAALFGALVSA